MSENTQIEWADHTFNPWIGCTKVGPGCDNCYAKADFDDRRHRVVWGAGQPRSRTKTWGDPVKWNKQADAFFAEHGRRQRVFCASMADVFDNAVPQEWRDDLFRLIAATPKLDWLLLTKRVGNVRGVLPADWGDGYSNVWMGISVVNQDEADRDIPRLLTVRAVKRFLSMEPLLGAVNLTHLNEDKETNEVNCLKPYTWEEEIENWRDTDQEWIEQFEDHYGVTIAGLVGPMHARIDWVIVGGESSAGARPMHPDWVKSLCDQCQTAGVPFLFKQWGEWTPGVNVDKQSGIVKTATWQSNGFSFGIENLASDDGHADDEPNLYRVGKKAAGRMLDGREWNGVPA